MKIRLELVINEDGSQYLNFWDSMHGNDVVCDVKGNDLFLHQYDDEGEELPPKQITLDEFIGMVFMANVS